MKTARVPADRGIMSSRFFRDVFSLESRPRLEPGAHDEQELTQERDYRAFQSTAPGHVTPDEFLGSHIGLEL